MNSLSATAGSTVVDIALAACKRWQDRVAVVDCEDGKAVTYSELRDAIAGWRDRLRALGARKGDGVALLSTNRLQIVPALLGILAAGCRYTPLHPLGSLEDQAFILGDAEIRFLIYEESAFAERADQLKAAAGIEALIQLVEPPSFDAMAAHPGNTPAEADPAFLLYTGGTTGRPKGVIWSHRQQVQTLLIQLAEWPWPAEVRFLAATPLSHGAICFVLPTLWLGGTVITLRNAQPEVLSARVEEHRVTATFLVPSLIYKLLDHPEAAARDLSSLRFLVYGASPIAPERLAALLQRFGQVLWQLYAQTEAPMVVTGLRPEDHDPSRPELLASCGRPLLGIQLELQDEDGREVPIGEVGEICVRGPVVMDGYWKRPEENEQTLAGGWLHTGDLARRDRDGYVFIVDRRKDMIVSGGMNVYPREVEDALLAHPKVRMCAVIGVPDKRWGEAVKAIVVPASPIEADELMDFVRQRKSAWQVPKTVDFVDEIPLTPVGKPDKKKLRAPYWGNASRQVN